MPAASVPARQPAVPFLIGAIALMTVAIFFLLGMVAGRLMSPTNAAPVTGVALVDFTQARGVEVMLPEGATVVSSAADAGRLTLVVRHEDGQESVLTTPLSGLEGPVHLTWAPQRP